MNVQTINDIYFYYYLLTKISEFYKNNVASNKDKKYYSYGGWTFSKGWSWGRWGQKRGW
jgi:hypothetical protein